MDGDRFATLEAAVRSRPALFKFSAPTIQAFARSRYFQGFMDYDEADKCLRAPTSKPGTFLIRLSRTKAPGAFVVAYREASGAVQQSLAFPVDFGRGVRVNDKVYASLDAFVESWPERLRYALGQADDDDVGAAPPSASGSGSALPSAKPPRLDRYGVPRALQPTLSTGANSHTTTTTTAAYGAMLTT